ncbi:MAG: response regulator [Sphingobacteriaceae bacterium]
MPKEFRYDTVILIDDNYIDNVIHQKILESCLFAKHILSFESAESALKYFKTLSQKKIGLPLIVFLDLRMPEIDGYAFLERLKEIPGLPIQQIRIYVLSSSLDPLDRKKVQKNELTHHFISKPLTEQTLAGL